MNYLVIGDLHLHNHNLFGESNKAGINQRLVDGLKAVREALNIAIKKQIKVVFCLGDIFENKKNIPTDVLSLTLQTFRLFKQNNIALVLLVGNHDKFISDDNKTLHTIEAFRDCATIIDKPTKLSIADTDFFLMPFMDYKKGMLQALYYMIDQDRNPEDKSPSQRPIVHPLLWNHIQEDTPKHHKVLMLHDDIGGVKYDNGVVSSSSILYTHLEPQYFDAIFSGHIHKKSEYLKMIYVGSLYQKDFNEEGDDKGVYLLKTKDKKLGYKFMPLNTKVFKTVDKDYKLTSEDKAYYKIKLLDTEVENWVQDQHYSWVENKNFILDIESSTKEVEQLEENDLEAFDLKEMSADFLSKNEAIYDKKKLDKNVIIDVLKKLGAI